ncbi:hypothetical protein [Aestuariivirga sp.]|uniref:hypothetical protein n=1 Tax=Aestuariivirga sp. TaxID=2650926 RepID=UPI0025C123D7|nr:hypothetical protein [Aestuariivirga sp.]MCA3554192.1 hypothetical protein [Aestuariivirga sp.]
MMDFRLDPLWLRLNLMNSEGLQAFAPLMDVMRRQMGQNAEMAQRAIEEYRKFLFLAMRAGHQVIPPGPVNDAWMLHLQNAQNYWEKLGQMIAEPPGVQGAGVREFASMADAWKATLESYEKIFGMKPPMDIWGQGPAAGNPWMQAINGWKKMFGMG